jgi:hypothetical protein
MANAQAITNGTLKVLLVGDAGSKKTLLASTFPDPHFVDLDDGMLVCRGRDVKYITIGERETTDPDFFAICKELNKVPEKMAKMSSFAKAQLVIEYWANTLKENQTLVLDSLTFYSEAALRHVQKLENPKDMRQTYGGAQKLIAMTFEQFKNIPANVVVIAHRTLVEEQEGVISYVPKTAGKSFALQLPSFFDEVWRATTMTKKVGGVQTQTYTIETFKTNREQGKTRLNLPQVIEDPTYDKIIALTKGN